MPSHIVLDGVRERVFWNDGDSFSIRSGPMKGTRARLHGFNSLEAYGPAHFWGAFDGHELFHISKKGTQLARETEWHCTRKEGTGGYNRILVDCPRLSDAIISTGYAHVFAMGGPPRPELMAYQKKAQAQALGIWSRGVPDHIVTSVHSQGEKKFKENPERRAYNRICDTRTGIASVIEHDTVFNACDAWCYGGSCMVYVPYELRYRFGAERILCMKRGHQNRLIPSMDGKPTLPPQLGDPMVSMSDVQR